MNDKPAPIVIVGARRSGTTLLRAMLSQHPDLLVHPHEPQFILELYKKYGSQIGDVAGAIQHLTDHRYCVPEVTAAQLRSLFQGRTSILLQELIAAYLEIWAGTGLQSRRPVLKHPALIFHLELVIHLFPDAQFVHVVRDPRANISSQLARWQKALFLECVDWWRDAVRIGHQLTNDQPRQCQEVTYQQLVLNSRDALQRLCEYLQIPFTEDMLTFELETRAFAPAREAEQRVYTQPDPARLELWRTYLQPVEIAMIEALCWDEMQWWGYTPDPATPRRSFFARYLWEQFKYSGLKLTRALTRKGRG